MTRDTPKQPGGNPSTQGRKAPSDERQDRLAAALRQNLARRKAQGRARKVSDKDATAGSEAPASSSRSSED